MPVCHPTAVRILSLHIAVYEFDKQQFFKFSPFCENFVGCSDREIRQEGFSLGEFVVNLRLAAFLEVFVRLCSISLIYFHSLRIVFSKSLQTAVFPGVNSFAYCRGHYVVSLVAGVGDTVAHPEGGGRGVFEHISITFAERLRDCLGICINRCKIRCCGIVAAEPYYSSHNVRQPAPALSHKPESSLLGGHSPFVHISLPVHFKAHRPPAVRKTVSSGPDVGCHIHRCALEMVPHRIGHILDSDFFGRFHEKRESLALVIAHCIVNVVVGIPRHFLSVFIRESELALAEYVECRPGAGLAGSHPSEIQWSIGVTETEFAVFAVKPSLAAGK